MINFRNVRSGVCFMHFALSVVEQHQIRVTKCKLHSTSICGNKIKSLIVRPYRDDLLIVIQAGSYNTLAIHGLSESLTPPSIRLKTRVAVHQITGHYVCGNECDEIIARSLKSYDVIYPIQSGVVEDWKALAALW